MNKEDIRKTCLVGISEDLNGEFYPIYNFNKIWDLIHTIDEEYLNNLAENSYPYEGEDSLFYDEDDIVFDLRNAFKKGYIKAKTEI